MRWKVMTPFWCWTVLSVFLSNFLYFFIFTQYYLTFLVWRWPVWPLQCIFVHLDELKQVSHKKSKQRWHFQKKLWPRHNTLEKSDDPVGLEQEIKSWPRFQFPGRIFAFADHFNTFRSFSPFYSPFYSPFIYPNQTLTWPSTEGTVSLPRKQCPYRGNSVPKMWNVLKWSANAIMLPGPVLP